MPCGDCSWGPAWRCAHPHSEDREKSRPHTYICVTHLTLILGIVSRTLTHMLPPPRYLLYLSTPTPEPRSAPAPAAAAVVTADQDSGDSSEPPGPSQRQQQPGPYCARSILEAVVRMLTQTQGLQQAGSPEGPPAPSPLASVAGATVTAEPTSPSVAAAAAAEPSPPSDVMPGNGNAVTEDDGRPRALQVGSMRAATTCRMPLVQPNVSPFM